MSATASAAAPPQPPLTVVLHQPEIPPNTGNVARTCAATGCRLLLIEPLGFDIDDAAVQRAGLDYWDQVEVRTLPDWSALQAEAGDAQMVLASSHGGRRYDRLPYRQGAYLVLGSETRGLPVELREHYRESCVRIPMRAGARSLNMANAAAVLVYEALRQIGAPGLR